MCWVFKEKTLYGASFASMNEKGIMERSVCSWLTSAKKDFFLISCTR